MLKQTAAFMALAVSIVAAGCSDSDGGVAATGPSSLLLPGSSFASVHPSFLSAQLIGNSACPELQPLRVTANLMVRADGDATVFLNEVRLGFIDTFGKAAPQITLPAPMLTQQFGTALVLARSTRTFPLNFSFGCSTGRTGTLIVFVRARHGHGREDSTEIRVGVR